LRFGQRHAHESPIMVRHPRESGARPRSGQAQKSDSKAGKGSKGAAGVPEKGERVAKALARAGIASRREVERLINLGKVAVNGRILDTPAVLVKRDDILTVDGKVVNEPEPARVWRYHKPVGLVTTHKDPQDRPTVFQNLPEGLPRVLSVGRLDLNSEGLLLLTNDGELARALELPGNGWKRIYRARALGQTTQEKLDRLKEGVTVEGINYGPIEAKLDKAQGANCWITVTLSEGKNREVRRVLESIGLKVNRLIRLAYGPFQLGTLGEGEVEEVGPRVIREQLAEFIAPENLPTGDRVATPPPAPGRRPVKKAAAPLHRPVTGDPLADPYRKPSRVRAAAEKAAAEAEAEGEARPRSRPGPSERRRAAAVREGATGERPERRAPKPGWAKAAPRPDRARPDRRRDDEGAERPFRPRGEGRARPAAREGFEGERAARPQRPFKPRAGGAPRTGEGEDRPYRKPAGRSGPPRDRRGEGDEGGRPQRSFKPRADGASRGGEREDRPYRKPAGRSGPPRERRGEGDEGGRPQRPFKPRAGGAPRTGESEDRPYRKPEGRSGPLRERRGEGDEGGRPQRPFKPRAGGAPRTGEREDRPYRKPEGRSGPPRERRGEGEEGGRPQRPFRPRAGGAPSGGPRGPGSKGPGAKGSGPKRPSGPRGPKR
jgi:23S rRNA pseudouridine2605 synthase